MKKYLLILLFPLVLSLASCGDNNVASSKEVLSQVNTALKTTNYVTYIQTRGDLSYEINSDTPFTGYYLQTYTNGEKDVITHYKDGMKNGPSAYWYENGQKKRVRVYKNGMKDGPFKSWYENGQKKTEGILIGLRLRIVS
jgi:antitoxin component YwqK of YwqJK toxin-antitoxin module